LLFGWGAFVGTVSEKTYWGTRADIRRGALGASLVASAERQLHDRRQGRWHSGHNGLLLVAEAHEQLAISLANYCSVVICTTYIIPTGDPGVYM
jgi:hypothetical protein